MNKTFYFHPLLWYLIGYCVWMLFPAFLTVEGHHLLTVVADLWGMIFLVVGYALGTTFKKFIFGKRKVRVNDSDLNYLVLTFLLILYFTRIKLFSEVGVYAFLHAFSRESSLLDTIATTLSMAYVILLMTLFYTTKKRIYAFLFTIEVLLFIVPQMARSYYIIVPLFYFLIMFYYSSISIKKILWMATPFLLAGLIFVSLVGPYINGVRSYAQIGKFDQGLELEYFSEEKSSSFIVNRLNVHGEAHNFERVIDTVVKLDMDAFASMAEKWLGLTSEYKVHPTSISTQAGELLGYGLLTSTDFPRSLVLANYPFPILTIATFNFFLGMLVACIFGLICSKDSKLFIMLWVPFIYAPMFGSGGAPPATFVFQFIFTVASYAVVYIIFQVVKNISRHLNWLFYKPLARMSAVNEVKNNAS